MIVIQGTVTGDQAVELKLRSMTIGVRGALRAAIERVAIDLTRYVKERKLSGQVLKNRTGTLRRKINYRVAESPHGVSASVGVKLSYAAIHEFGFSGTENVREHLRTVTQVFGRALSEPIRTTVRAHSREVHMPARSYLRSSLHENAPKILATLRAAVAEAVAVGAV